MQIATTYTNLLFHVLHISQRYKLFNAMSPCLLVGLRYVFFYTLVLVMVVHEAAGNLVFISFMTFFSQVNFYDSVWKFLLN